MNSKMIPSPLAVLLSFALMVRTAYSMPASLEADSIQANTDSIRIDWSDSGMKYCVYRDGQLVYTGTESRYEDANLQPGFTYSYRIDTLSETDETIDSLSIQTETDKPGRTPLDHLNDLRVTTVVKKDKVSLDWEDIQGASEYSIFKNKEYVTTVKDSAYTDYQMDADKANTYNIVAKRKKVPLFDEEIDIEKTIANAENLNEPIRRWHLRYATFLADRWVKNPNPFSDYVWFKGDHRGYDASASSFRTRADVTVCFCPEGPSVELKRSVGATRGYDANKHFRESRTSPSGGIKLQEVNASGRSRISFKLKHTVGNPFGKGMDIDYEVHAEFDRNGNYKLSGVHDQAPHHEAYLKESDRSAFKIVHQADSKGLLWLASPMPKKRWSKSNFNY